MKLNIKEAFPIDHLHGKLLMTKTGLTQCWNLDQTKLWHHQRVLHYMRSCAPGGAAGGLLRPGRVFNGKSNSQGAIINNKPHHPLAQQGLADRRALWRPRGGLSVITSGFLRCRSASWLDKTFNNFSLTANDLQVIPRGEIQYRSGWGLGRWSWYQLFVTVRGSSSPPRGWWLRFPTCRVNMWMQPLIFGADWWSQLWLYTSKQWKCSLWWGPDSEDRKPWLGGTFSFRAAGLYCQICNYTLPVKWNAPGCGYFRN